MSLSPAQEQRPERQRKGFGPEQIGKTIEQRTHHV